MRILDYGKNDQSIIPPCMIGSVQARTATIWLCAAEGCELPKEVACYATMRVEGQTRWKERLKKMHTKF